MRIARFDLMAFGPFTGACLDFGDGAPDLHVIVGRNEAGKSTTLRALTALLYGIDERTPDNHLHDNPSLRLGALLHSRDGASLQIVRRKGRKRTLLDAEGKPLDDRLLAPFLAGVDKDRFRTVFGIGHEDLALGARELLEGGADVGQSLFAAGLGAGGLRALLVDLDAEADALFKPRGSKQRLNRAVRGYSEAARRVRELSLSSPRWAEQRKRLDELERQVADVASELHTLTTERTRVERLRKILPLLGERRELQRQLDAMQEVVIVDDAFKAEHLAAMADLRAAREARDGADDRKRRLLAKMADVRVDEPLLARAAAVASLSRQLGEHEKARKDASGLRGKRGQQRADAHAIHEQLQPGVPLDEMHDRRPRADLKARVRDLVQRHEALEQAWRRTRKDVRQHTAELEQAREQLAVLPPPRRAEALRDALNEPQQHGDPERELAATEAALHAEQEAAAAALSALGGWRGELAQAETLAVPAVATIERFEQEMADLDRARDRAAAERDRLDDELAGLRQKLDALRGAGEVPSEAELEAKRSGRQRRWALVRRAWLQGDEVAALVAELDGDLPLPEAYERSVDAADEIADRLRREADRVATRAELEARRARLEPELSARDNELGGLAADADALQRRWTSLWEAIDVLPLPPREMRAWAGRHAELVERAERLRRLRGEVALLGAALRTRRATLGVCLREIGEPAAIEGETLAALVARAGRVAAHIEEVERRRERHAERVEALQRAVHEATLEHAQAAEDLERWGARWRVAVAELGLPAEAGPVEANEVLDKLAALFAALDKAAEYERRIARIERDAQTWADEVAGLVSALAPDLAGRPPEQAADELQRRLDRAKEAQATRKQQREELDGLEQDLATTARSIAHNVERLDGLCARVGCAGHADLPGAIAASDERVALLRRRDELERAIVGHGGGATVDEWVRASEDVDADALPGQVQELDRAIRAQQDQRSALDQEIGRTRAELARLDGSAEAAEEADKAQAKLAEIRDHAERYMRLRLAGTLLRREVERYRERHQGPVLRRASALFATLTDGSFAGLRTDVDQGDEPVIVGLRPGGQGVHVAGMSDGTRDQLYLAIRLATLAVRLEHDEPIPLVLDDILIRFDDDRSLAALRALAELAAQTQVLFFTHHGRLAELAEGLGEGKAVVHRL